MGIGACTITVQSQRDMRSCNLRSRAREVDNVFPFPHRVSQAKMLGKGAIIRTFRRVLVPRAGIKVPAKCIAKALSLWQD
jgi:hypothetical protein